MSQLKLALTRDPRATAIINPKGPEAKKLKSPSAGKTMKAAKATKRPQVSTSISCHQTLLKFVSTSNSKPKVLKTLSENSVQVESKPKILNNSENAIQVSEAKPKVVEGFSENSVVVEDKCKGLSDSKSSLQAEVKSKAMTSNYEENCIASEPDSTVPAILKPSQATTSSVQTVSSSSQLVTTPISLPTPPQASQSTSNLPTIMSSHPVTSFQQPSSFKPVPSKVSPVSSKQTSAACHPVPGSSREQHTSNPPPLINCSPPTKKCSQPSAVKVSPLLAKHLQQNGGVTSHSLVSSNKEKPVQIATAENNASPVAMATATIPPSIKDNDLPLTPPHPKRARRQTAVLLPISRVRTIMKTNFQSSKNGPQLGQESVPIVCKAAVSPKL